MKISEYRIIWCVCVCVCVCVRARAFSLSLFLSLSLGESYMGAGGLIGCARVRGGSLGAGGAGAFELAARRFQLASNSRGLSWRGMACTFSSTKLTNLSWRGMACLHAHCLACMRHANGNANGCQLQWQITSTASSSGLLPSRMRSLHAEWAGCGMGVMRCLRACMHPVRWFSHEWAACIHPRALIAP